MISRKWNNAWIGLLTMLWNCIVQSINKDDIGFVNLKKNNDSIQCKHDYMKMDKTREKYSNDNSSVNPNNQSMRLFLV